MIYECISAGGLGTSAADADLLAQGVAMRDALAADLARLDGLAVSCVASREAPLGKALSTVRAVAAPAPAAEPAELACDFLQRAGRDFDRVWVIAPESDDLLARLADAVGAPRWVGCSQEAIRLAGSKNATRDRLAAHGIAVPASWAPGDPDPERLGGWVVKPDDGAGSVDTLLHPGFQSARADYLRRLSAGRASSIEAWVSGVPLSLSLLYTAGRAELLSINAQRISARPGGPVVYGGVETGAHPIESKVGRRLAALAKIVGNAVPGLEGYVGIDLVWRQPAGDRALRDDGQPVVIEINPRLTCAYVGLSAALGRNLAGEILRAGQPLKVPHVLH